MAVSQVLYLSWGRGGETLAPSTPVTISVDGATDRSFAVTAATSNVQVALVVDVSEIKLLYILSDQDVLLETNNSSSPAQAFTIAANKPFLWYYGCGWTNPLSTDITTTYWTNAGATDANVELRVLVDATP